MKHQMILKLYKFCLSHAFFEEEMIIKSPQYRGKSRLNLIPRSIDCRDKDTSKYQEKYLHPLFEIKSKFLKRFNVDNKIAY